MKDLLSIDGIADTTAKAFNNGLKIFFDFVMAYLSLFLLSKRKRWKTTIPNQFVLQDSETNSGKSVL